MFIETDEKHERADINRCQNMAWYQLCIKRKEEIRYLFIWGDLNETRYTSQRRTFFSSRLPFNGMFLGTESESDTEKFNIPFPLDGNTSLDVDNIKEVSFTATNSIFEIPHDEEDIQERKNVFSHIVRSLPQSVMEMNYYRGSFSFDAACPFGSDWVSQVANAETRILLI